jgi:hypothetical protein
LTIDVADTLRRWETKRKGDFSPGSLTTYKTRFRRAIEEYGKWYENPSGYRPDAKQRSRTPVRTGRNGGSVAPAGTETAETQTTPTFTSAIAPKTTPVLTYPFPLRPGVLARLELPSDLNKRESKRLCAFIDSLADDEPQALGRGQDALPAGTDS